MLNELSDTRLIEKDGAMTADASFFFSALIHSQVLVLLMKIINQYITVNEIRLARNRCQDVTVLEMM